MLYRWYFSIQWDFNNWMDVIRSDCIAASEKFIAFHLSERIQKKKCVRMEREKEHEETLLIKMRKILSLCFPKGFWYYKGTESFPSWPRGFRISCGWCSNKYSTNNTIFQLSHSHSYVFSSRFSFPALTAMKDQLEPALSDISLLLKHIAYDLSVFISNVWSLKTNEYQCV